MFKINKFRGGEQITSFLGLRGRRAGEKLKMTANGLGFLFGMMKMFQNRL